MKFLFLEPFFGGSHRDFAEGLARHSRHDVELLTLPACFWKWRMRGAALEFIRKAPPLEDYDGLIAGSLMSLADFRALAGPSCPPAVVYFHENQFTYPLSPGEVMDFQYGFTHLTTALAAKKILFNSRTHLEAFFAGLSRFIKMMPDTRPRWAVPVLREKAEILYPGCCFPGGNPALTPFDGRPPLVIWNHRWEFDKNPDAFFDVLDRIQILGPDFRLAVMGENFSKKPAVFVNLEKRFGKRLVHCGYLESRAAYYRMLQSGHIVISTAWQENFGISMVEAMRFGCLPLLPNRLSYPEILPKEFHADFLYDSEDQLAQKLAGLLGNYSRFLEKRAQLSRAMARFSWDHMIEDYDRLLDGICN